MVQGSAYDGFKEGDAIATALSNLIPFASVNGSTSPTGDVYNLSFTSSIGSIGGVTLKMSFGPQGRHFNNTVTANGGAELDLVTDLATANIDLASFNFGADSLTISWISGDISYDRSQIQTKLVDDIFNATNNAQLAQNTADLVEWGMEIFAAIDDEDAVIPWKIKGPRPTFTADFEQFSAQKTILERIDTTGLENESSGGPFGGPYGSTDGFQTISHFEIYNENFVAVVYHGDGADFQRFEVWHRSDTTYPVSELEDAYYDPEIPSSDLGAALMFNLHTLGFQFDGAFYQLDLEGAVQGAFVNSFDAEIVANGIVDGTVSGDIIDGSYVDADGDSISDEGQTIFASSGNDSIYAGAGDDSIKGDDGDDVLVGGAGDDTLSGGSGSDTAVFNLNFADATIEAAGNFLAVVSAADGSDLVQDDVEFVVFNDVTYTFADLYVFASNAEPVAVADTLTVGEDQVSEIDVLANDSDADGDPLSVTMVGGQTISVGNPVTLISGAIVALLPNGALSYDPNGAFESLETGETASETITYTISDGQGGTTDGTLSVTIEGYTPPPPNEAPVTVDDAATIETSGTVLVDVLANDTDADGDALALTSVTGAANGTAVIEAGQVRYTANAGFVGEEPLTYGIDDGQGGTATGSVTITVAPPSGPLGDQTGTSGADVFYHTTGNGSYAIQDLSYSGSVLDRLVFTDLNLGDVTFTQNAGEDLVITTNTGEVITITDHFDGTYEDMELIEFADGTVLDAQAIRDKSVADQQASGQVLGSEHAETYHHALGDGSYTIQDFSYSGAVQDRLVFADVNAADVSFSQNAGKDLVITLGNGETITVTDHFDGSYEDMELIEFADGTVLDAQAIRDRSVADMKAGGAVIGSEHAESYHHALGDGSYTIQDFSYSGSVLDRLVLTDQNITDVTFSDNAGKDLIITLGNGETITLTDHFDGTYEDMEEIEFADGTVLDARGMTLTDLMSATGNTPPANADPETVDDTATVDEDGTVLVNVLANDTDADGDTLTLTSVTGAANGTTVIEAGQVRYTPNAGFSGTDTLTYAIDDGQGGTATGSISITINPAPPPSGDKTGTAGADIFTHTTGDGSYAIQDLSYSSTVLDRLIFTDQNVSDVTFSQNAGEDLVITTNAGEVITITDHFDGTAEDMELIEFADGTVLDAQAIRDKSVADQKATGAVIGSEHAETYTHALGDGSYSIHDFSYSGSVQDRLILTDVNATDVTFAQNAGEDLIITFGNGEAITIIDHFDGLTEDMELIEFADGTVLGAQEIRDKSVADMKATGAVIGSEHAETYHHALGDGSYTIQDFSYSSTTQDRLVLTDTNAADVTFAQNAGEDLIITFGNGEAITVIDHFDGLTEDMELIEFADGTVLGAQEIRDKSVADMRATGAVIGSEHAETYTHTLGDGSYTIQDFSYSGSVQDRLILTDVNAADVTFAQNAGEDLVVTFGNGEAVTVIDHFDGLTEDMELIEFADGTVLDAQAIRDKSVADMKTTGAVIGSEHAETYTHALGDGSYSIQDFSYSSSTVDTFVFTDLNASDITFSQNTDQDLVMDLSNGEQIIVVDHFRNTQWDMEEFVFADGTVLGANDLILA